MDVRGFFFIFVDGFLGCFLFFIVIVYFVTNIFVYIFIVYMFKCIVGIGKCLKIEFLG